MQLYEQYKNQKRKKKNTGDVVEDAGQNKNVKQYTSATQGTARQQAASQAKIDKQKSANMPVKTMKDFSPEELEQMTAAANQKKPK